MDETIICKCVEGHFAAEWKTEHDGEWTRHSQTYRTEEELKQRINDQTIDWSGWQPAF